MAAAQWWVIALTKFGSPPSYEYFQGTRAQAQAAAARVVEVSTAPAITGPFASKAAAQASVAAGKANTPGLPGGYAQSSPLTGINAIGDFFSRLTQSATWIRAGKVIIGGLLLIVGLVHITGISGAAADVARKVPLPA